MKFKIWDSDCCAKMIGPNTRAPMATPNSGLRREISSAATGCPIQDVIQTDAAINPGNIGGPLLDSSGNLIGINTAIYSPSGASSGVGLSIPVDTVSGIVDQLVKFGKVTRPILGIKFAPDQSVKQLGVSGVLILDAPSSGPAGKAVQEAASGSFNVQMSDVWINLARVHFAQGNFAFAVKMYQNCLRKFFYNTDSQVLLYLARTHYEAKQWQDCKKTLLRAIHLASSNYTLRFDAGVTLQKFSASTLQKTKRTG